MSGIRTFFILLKKALKGENIDATQGKIDAVIFLLAVPMIIQKQQEAMLSLSLLVFPANRE